MNQQNKFSEVVIVEASAGSGKTLELAKRYIKLLLNANNEPNSLENILAITFTNKATVEMKERILEILKRIALNSFENPQQEEEIFLYLEIEKKICQNKALNALEQIIRNYNFFNIKTIDSFINAILSGLAFNIGRSATFKIKNDCSDFISSSFDILVEEAVKNKTLYKLLEEFLEHYLFLENKTSWFPKKDILELLRTFFFIINKFGYSFYFYDAKIEDLLKRKKEVFRKIKKIVKDIPEYFEQRKLQSIINFVNNNTPCFNSSEIPEIFSKPIPTFKKEMQIPTSFLKEWNLISKELTQILELESQIKYNPYIKLFEKVFEIFEDLAKRKDVLFLEELNRKVSLLFDEQKITVPELYYRLASKFLHYLIDEFQDTSLLQWENLKIIIEDALANGGSLFYVGDKKQAIYRFRGGDARLFDIVKEQFSHFNVKERRLFKNWRSHKNIVEFNNRIFSKENLKNMLILSGISTYVDDLDDIISVFEDAQQEYNQSYLGGYVYVERIFEKNQAERNGIMEQKILELISFLKERFEYEDIAILAKDNDEVELITSWLLHKGIPVISEKTLNVIENSLIEEIVSFLKFLYSPPDDLSFASFILGKIFTTATGISKETVADFIFTLNKENRLSKATLYRFFREQFAAIWQEYIEEFFKNVGYLSLYELVISIYKKFRVYENFCENQGFFMKFLELIKNKEDEYIGLAKFLSYLEVAPSEELYVDVAKSNGINVLTIHKAKGLEFGVVIVPFFRIDITPETFSKKSGFYIKIENNRLKLLHITKMYRTFSSKLNQIYKKAYTEACIDELNALYVALTRAKYELYIFIPKKSNNENNKAANLIPKDFVEYGEKFNYLKKPKDTQAIIDISPSKYKDWFLLLKEEFFDAQYIKNRERILEGIILHTILSQIGNCNDVNLEELIEKAIAFTKAKFIFFKNITNYKEKVKNILQNESLKNIFYVDDGEIFCEKEVIDEKGDIKRIDRLIIKNNQVWIIDYKSSYELKEAQYLQVKEYMKILKDIYPSKLIRGFIIYLDTAKLEEVI
ncbi:MAG: UvrD-helicase domain-containing protein [Candidatus Omnitrophica bacterium]|nr:UvrD-helicase domain-containing protein [Candidatus Omnitrophota bacterium]